MVITQNIDYLMFIIMTFLSIATTKKCFTIDTLHGD